MSYLLDTDTCIAVINNRPETVRRRLARTIREEHLVPCVSAITLLELSYGVAKSQRVAENTARLEVFVSEVELLDFEPRDAHAAGRLRAQLERQGERIGAYDTLIAGQAITRGLVLVTGNVREFARAPGLLWENWIRP